MTETKTPWLGRAAAAKHLGVHPHTVTRWHDIGLPFYLVGGRYYYSPEELDAFVRSNRGQGLGLKPWLH